MHSSSQPTTLFAVSDIHGHLDALQRALQLVDLSNNPGAQLVFCGDYLDRGPASCQVATTLRDLQKAHPGQVIVLAGNHEADFCDWLFDDDDFDATWLLADAEFETIRSFLTAEQLAQALASSGLGSSGATPDAAAYSRLNGAVKQAIRSAHGPLLKWLTNLPLVHETDTQIFVHAGVDEEAGQLWKAATDEHTLLNKFPATTGAFAKTVIAGHVGAWGLNPDKSSGIFHDGASHYYIDGSVEHTGCLNVLQWDTATGSYTFHNQI